MTTNTPRAALTQGRANDVWLPPVAAARIPNNPAP